MQAIDKALGDEKFKLLARLFNNTLAINLNLFKSPETPVAPTKAAASSVTLGIATKANNKTKSPDKLLKRTESN